MAYILFVNPSVLGHALWRLQDYRLEISNDSDDLCESMVVPKRGHYHRVTNDVTSSHGP